MFNIINKIRTFVSDERGTATTEAVIVLPMLVWSMVATSVYFDGFRARSTNLKAAYTISDMISRENPYVGPNYINGLKKAYDFLAASRNPTWIRVSLVQFDTEDPTNDSDGFHIVKWSYGTTGIEKLPDGTGNNTLNNSAVEARIPIMMHGDTIILVETHMKYVPFAKIGIDPFSQDNFIATRPRFTPPQWSASH